jgi:nucleotide-binding universal stress UspA family protein
VGEAHVRVISQTCQLSFPRGIASLFEKILVPLDGSEHSMHALEKAVQIAKNFDAKITLIKVYSLTQPVVTASLTVAGSPTVMTGSMASAGSIPSEVLSKLSEAHREAGANILTNGKDRARTEGVQVETLLKEGHTVEEILKTANEGKYDLIVVGARGLSTIKEILLGSVSHGVVMHANCPVLVVK